MNKKTQTEGDTSDFNLQAKLIHRKTKTQLHCIMQNLKTDSHRRTLLLSESVFKELFSSLARSVSYRKHLQE